MYLSIEEPEKTTFASQPVWDLAFRPGFLLASAWSVVSLGLWVAYLLGAPGVLSTTAINPLLWHIHEMLFGFAATVALSFILTASQTWTGLRSLHGKGLIAWVVLWVVTRIALLLPGLLGIGVAVVASLAWWGLAIGVFWRLIERAKNRRNRIFVPVLVAMMSLDIGLLIAAYTNHVGEALVLGRAAVLVIGLLIGLVGGRVIPFFTQRAITNCTIKPRPWLDNLLLLTSFAGALVFVATNIFNLGLNPAWLMFAAGFLHLVRQSLWWNKGVLANPLLWSLHLSNFALGFGLLLLGLSYFMSTVTFAGALHLIAIGSIGAMILSMMCRVSLGHTGRMLKVSKIIVLAFVFIFSSALVRVVLSLNGLSIYAWGGSAVLWGAAFITFLVFYTPILLAPRADAL